MNHRNVDVTKQFQQIATFILQEAYEKIEELEIKTEEEFKIEKNRLVNEQRFKIIESYATKEKQMELIRVKQRSHLIVTNHLFILKAHDRYVQALKEEAKQQLIFLTRDRTKYINVLFNLITQGLLILLEKDITLRCRRTDYKFVQQLIPYATRQYEKIVKQKLNLVTVDDKEFISDDLIGGVEIFGLNGNIKVSNTLNDRLNLIFYQMLPEIRHGLFGINQFLTHDR